MGLFSLCLLAPLMSCAADPRAKLDDGSVALGGRRYDDAIGDANAVLDDRQSAEAYYLRGRAEEERPKPDAAIEQADLDRARQDYDSALSLNPPKPLEANIRAGLANIAYLREDYATALLQWTRSIDNLDRPEWKGSALYRVGVCQQRLGRYADADATFDKVQEMYQGSELADRAKAHEGVRGFFVQLGTFAKPADADSAVAEAATTGVTASTSTGPGVAIVRAGPFTTYSQARAARMTLVGRYPDAIIFP